MINENTIRLSSDGILTGTKIKPSASKSESNRSLIINALSGNLGQLDNLSDARDTQTMKRLLSSNDNLFDVLDAGTTMRFLTGYLAVTTKKKVTLTGSARMQERPIKVLVEALNSIGADIAYLKNEGYPPIEIGPFLGQETRSLSIPSNISSQYISAILMIAPVLPEGLKLELVGEVYSEPYIRMTLALMRKFGIAHDWNGQTIEINHQEYTPAEYTIESDWSGTSYWYGLVSLAQEGSMKLLGIRENSYQGDSVVDNIMSQMGVSSDYSDDTVELKKGATKESLAIDFKNCPDLAMTIMVSAAAQGIDLSMTGLESLKIKETDRIAAMQAELKKVNVALVELDQHHWRLETKDFHLKVDTLFETYDDHRMAMAFAPLCMLEPIQIEDPDVVAKSYPDFWEDLKKVGVTIV